MLTFTHAGNLSTSSVAVVFASYKSVSSSGLPFQNFVRCLSALATGARANVHELVAGLATADFNKPPVG